MADITAHSGSVNLDTGGGIVERFVDNLDGTWSRQVALAAGGGGGGAATIANGADVTQGANADAGVQGDTGGTLSAKARGLNQAIGTSADTAATVSIFGFLRGILAQLVFGRKTATNSLSVALATDQTGAAGTPATQVVSVQGITSGTNVQVGGNVANGATNSGNPVLGGGVYELNPTALTDGQRGSLLLTNARELRTYQRALQTNIDAVQIQGVPGAVIDTNARLVDGFGGVAIGSYTPGGTATAAANVAGINTKTLAFLAANTTVSVSPGNSLDFDVSRFTALQLELTTGTVAGAGTLTFTLSTKGADGNYAPVFVTTAIGATSTVLLSLGRGMPTVPVPGTPQAAGTYSWAAELGSTVRLGIVLAGTSVNCGYSLIAKM